MSTIYHPYLDLWQLNKQYPTPSGKPAVTGELTVRYVEPVPSETPLLGRGRLVADHGRYVDVEGSLEVFSARRVVATARGRFFPVDLRATRA